MPHRMMVIQVIQKPIARSIGLTRYLTGKPCKHGHIALRYSNGVCSACVTVRSEKWKNENPEKVKKAKDDYLSRNKEKHAAAVRSWQERNIPKLRLSARQWRYRNPDKLRLLNMARRALKKKAGGSFGPIDLYSVLLYQDGFCAACNIDILDNYHVDHVIPLSKGGRHDISNIQVLCPTCNISKGAKNHEEWLASRKEKRNACV